MSIIIEINQFNLNSGILNKHKDKLHSHTHWHQVIVENVEGLDKFTVLNTVMKFCYPLHFIPVHYQSSRNVAHFLMKNCGSALERMCNKNLIIPNKVDNDKPLKISIQLCYATANELKINIEDTVKNVLRKRFNLETNTLDLDNFVMDPDLEEFCPLSQPKLLFYILHLSRNCQFKSLKLSNNEIEILKPLEALNGMKNLVAVDLRNNCLNTMSGILHLKHLNVRELWLDGNSLCDNYDEYSYAKTAGEYLPSLEKLDGVKIPRNGFLAFKRNFLCLWSGYDLVDQFLEHYFTLYDSASRTVLDGLYHKDALFSLTATYVPSQSTSLTARLSAYKKVSRNLIQISDFAKNVEFLFTGSNDIIKLLASFPPSDHDPFSFTVDLISYNDKMAIIVVSGVFREIPQKIFESERLLHFTRTFVLLAGENKEYTIINEMAHISNAMTVQAAKAFKEIKVPRDDQIHIPLPQDSTEMLQLIEALKALSGMNMAWSKKFLEEYNYNLEKALVLFVDLYKMDKIPENAFNCASDKKSNSSKEINVADVDLKSLLRESDETTTRFIETTAPQPPNTIVHPILGTIQPQTNPHISNPPIATTAPMNLPISPIISPMTFPRPMVPPMRNIHPANLSIVPTVCPLKPIVHPMKDVQSQINQPLPIMGNFPQVIPPRPIISSNIQGNAGSRQKTAFRSALVKIQINK